VQFEVFVAWIGVSHIIVALRFAVSRIDLPRAVVAEFIHEAILHSWKDHVINPVAVSSHIVFFFDVRVDPTTDTHHPQEFVDVVARISTHTSVDNQHIVHI
jgi:hypothetical protein